jgi:hypothetical protein
MLAQSILINKVLDKDDISNNHLLVFVVGRVREHSRVESANDLIAAGDNYPVLICLDEVAIKYGFKLFMRKFSITMGIKFSAWGLVACMLGGKILEVTR